MNLTTAILDALADPRARLTYGTVVTSWPLTITVGPSTVAVPAVSLGQHGAGTYVAVLEQGADRLVLGRIVSNSTVNIFGTDEVLRISGSGRPYLAIYNSAGVRVMYVGYPDPSGNHVWVVADLGELRLAGGGGNGVTVYAPAIGVNLRLDPTAWTAPTLINSWVNYGGTWQVAQYRKIGDMVYIRGMVKNGVVGWTIFALPAGFRPPASLQFACESVAAHGVVVVNPTGNVDCAVGNNASFNLNVEFSVS